VWDLLEGGQYCRRCGARRDAARRSWDRKQLGSSAVRWQGAFRRSSLRLLLTLLLHGQTSGRPGVEATLDVDQRSACRVAGRRQRGTSTSTTATRLAANDDALGVGQDLFHLGHKVFRTNAAEPIDVDRSRRVARSEFARRAHVQVRRARGAQLLGVGHRLDGDRGRRRRGGRHGAHGGRGLRRGPPEGRRGRGAAAGVGRREAVVVVVVVSREEGGGGRRASERKESWPGGQSTCVAS